MIFWNNETRTSYTRTWLMSKFHHHCVLILSMRTLIIAPLRVTQVPWKVSLILSTWLTLSLNFIHWLTSNHHSHREFVSKSQFFVVENSSQSQHEWWLKGHSQERYFHSHIILCGSSFHPPYDAHKSRDMSDWKNGYSRGKLCATECEIIPVQKKKKIRNSNTENIHIQ
jgi:hypothetical protein